MADKTQEQSPIKSLTVTAFDLGRFIEAKGIDRECTECGDKNWLLPLQDGYDDGDSTAPVQLAALPGLGNNRSIPVHTLLCKTCGSLKLIHAGTVRDWVKENG